jgi:predicted 3-demethylubiquinone-9 3-methyltransferase (glyoxalase superfamily)
MPKITPFLWFDTQAEEAADFYVSVFKNSKIIGVSRYAEDTPGPAGSVMTVGFQLDGQDYTALNGGPLFKFNESISFVVHCADQAEVDEYWNALTADGGEESQCGWLKDKYGVSWQIVPDQMFSLLMGPDKAGAERATQAMLKMHKLDLQTLQDAYDAK